MSNSYVKTPTSISFSHIVEKDFTLSSSQYMDLVMPNQNFLYVRDFLNRPLQRKDLGVEVGSLNYIGKSTHYFLRTKALQEHSFIPEITSETAVPVNPKVFVNFNLKKGDLIISKDSNIGEIVILDKDYPNYMLSGALYKLPVSDKKYYLLAFIKHNIFREQLDFMVPKGATIRHAKTLFLDCKIPMPNRNADITIKFVELLTQAIINKEKLIRERHEAILKVIETELLENQKPNKFKFELPRINELEEVSRLDTGIYTEQFKKINFLIQNYKNGFFKIDANKIKGGSTPEVRFIGNIKALKNRWVTPTHCSDYGTLTEERINLEGNNNINEDCILLINRTSKGGIGEYVGIAGFYNFADFGKGHHNQGMYRVFKYETHELLFMLCFLNCSLMRKYCAGLSVGSKMKELKTEQFLQIPFPNFEEQKQKEIALLYHNPNSNYQADTFTLDNFLEQDNAFNETAGIYELDKTAKQLKKILNKAIDDIANDREVNINFTL